MEETKIDLAEFKSEGSDLMKELTSYLKEKTRADVESTTDGIVVKGEEATVSRTYLRVLLRKFLHKNDLKEYYRVIGGKENTLVLKGRKVEEEE
jgi:Ribosomal L22e protein family